MSLSSLATIISAHNGQIEDNDLTITWSYRLKLHGKEYLRYSNRAGITQ